MNNPWPGVVVLVNPLPVLSTSDESKKMATHPESVLPRDFVFLKVSFLLQCRLVHA